MNSFPMPNHIDTLGGCPLAASGTYSICNNFEGKIGSSQDPINLSIKVDHQTGKGRFLLSGCSVPASTAICCALDWAYLPSEQHWLWFAL